MSSKKANNFTPANLDDLANQLFDKTKQMSLSIKDQRKLLKEYLSAKIEGSDESEKEEESDTDSYSESDSDSENDSYSDSEDDSDTEFDEETEESSEESNSELESLDDDREITKPTKAVTQMSEKNLAASLVDKKKGNEISTREHKHSKSLETKLVSLSQPTSRIQHRTTMAGGLVAAPIRNSLPFNKEVKLPSKSEIKSCQIANKVTLSPRAEDQKPLNKPSVNLKAGDFSKEIKQTTIKLADPRS